VRVLVSGNRRQVAGELENFVATRFVVAAKRFCLQSDNSRVYYRHAQPRTERTDRSKPTCNRASRRPGHGRFKLCGGLNLSNYISQPVERQTASVAVPVGVQWICPSDLLAAVDPVDGFQIGQVARNGRTPLPGFPPLHAPRSMPVDAGRYQSRSRLCRPARPCAPRNPDHSPRRSILEVLCRVAAATEQRRTSSESFTSSILRNHREAALGLSAGHLS
jgi:hypothetical protein